MSIFSPENMTENHFWLRVWVVIGAVLLGLGFGPLQSCYKADNDLRLKTRQLNQKVDLDLISQGKCPREIGVQ